jgi:DNA-binding YbaB/EbfC family protein
MARALEMQQRLIDAQAEAESETVEGIAGGGKVRVTMTGAGEVTAVRIEPSVVDPNEVDLLEDLIVAALRDAATRVGLLAEQRLNEGLGGGLAELFGGGAAGEIGEGDADEQG